MTSASHALIGAAIASKIPNPYIGLSLAFFGHFVADLIPHWDFAIDRRVKTRRRFFFEAVFDVLLGFITVWYVFNHLPVHPAYLLAAIITAQLPDWVEWALPSILNYHGFPVPFVHRLQQKLHWKMGLPWGLVTQLAIILGLLIVLGILPIPSFYLFAR